MLILVDQDGVLADFERGFYDAWQASNHPYPAIRPEHRRHFYVRDDYPPDFRADATAIMGAKGFFLGLPAIAGAAEAPNQLLALGHDVRICTSPLNIYNNCVQEKYGWVEQHLGMGFIARMIVTKDKTVVQGDVLVDDKPTVTGTRTPAWQHVVYDQPYNRHVGTVRMTWGNWKHVLLNAQ